MVTGLRGVILRDQGESDNHSGAALALQNPDELVRL
jgi:hypothetical protein